MSDSLARARLASAARLFAKIGLPSLVLFTDEERLGDPLAAARALPRGGMVVVRARDPAKRRDLAGSLLAVARRRGLATLIADDPELAVDMNASGAHFPEARIAQAARSKARHPALAVTCAAHSLRAVLAAQRAGADAIFLSPIFETASHPGRGALSPVRASLIARAAFKPVYALGGVDARNAGRLSRAAFVGIAAIGALAV